MTQVLSEMTRYIPIWTPAYKTEVRDQQIYKCYPDSTLLNIRTYLVATAAILYFVSSYISKGASLKMIAKTLAFALIPFIDHVRAGVAVDYAVVEAYMKTPTPSIFLAEHISHSQGAAKLLKEKKGSLDKNLEHIPNLKTMLQQEGTDPAVKEILMPSSENKNN